MFKVLHCINKNEWLLPEPGVAKFTPCEKYNFDVSTKKKVTILYRVVPSKSRARTTK